MRLVEAIHGENEIIFLNRRRFTGRYLYLFFIIVLICIYFEVVKIETNPTLTYSSILEKHIV